MNLFCTLMIFASYFPSWFCFCRYIYELEASTDAGSSVSSQYIIQTPVSTPEKIPAPYNVSVLGPRSVFVVWSLPGNVFFTLMRDAPSLFSNHSAVIYPRFCARRRKFTSSVARIVMRASRLLDVAENQLARHSNSSGGFPNISVIYWGAV